jgi:hypothetical protein
VENVQEGEVVEEEKEDVISKVDLEVLQALKVPRSKMLTYAKMPITTRICKLSSDLSISPKLVYHIYSSTLKKHTGRVHTSVNPFVLEKRCEDA